MKPFSDLDALMWTVAESGDRGAVEDFARRFPEHRAELESRTALLGGLRSARAVHVGTPVRPAFSQATPQAKSSPFRTKAALGVALLAGIALASAGYFGATRESSTGSLTSGHSGPICTPKVLKENVERPRGLAETGEGNRTSVTPTVIPPQTSGEVVVDDMRPACDRPQTVALRQVPLKTAVQAIAGKSKITVDTAPDLPNPVVDATYDKMSAADMFTDLGERYGFTSVREDKTHFLLIPAKPKA